MEQGPPPPFEEYILGAAVPAGFVVHQGLVIPLPIYQVLRLAKVQAPPEANHMYQTYCNFKLPVFAGKEDNNFQMWIKTAVNKIHQYHIRPEHWVREAGNFLEGLALVWYNSWLNTPGNHSWQEFADGMHRRFGRNHSALSIARMWDNLKQEGSVEDYIKAHDKIQLLSDNQVQADQGFVRHAFIQNLKPGLAKFL